MGFEEPFITIYFFTKSRPIIYKKALGIQSDDLTWEKPLNIQDIKMSFKLPMPW